MGHAENEELRDETIAELTRRHAAAISTNVRIGHEQTLSTVAERLALRLSGSGVTEQLVGAALASGPYQAGQMLIDLIVKCVAIEAELEAIKEVERMEHDDRGLDVEAMRRESAPASHFAVTAALAVVAASQVRP